MESGKESPGKNLISWKILTINIAAQVIMMLILINMVLSVEHRSDLGKIKAGLMK